MTSYIDTNILVRYFVRDNEPQYLQALNWFEKAQKGELGLSIHPIVVAETCYVLESFYQVGRLDIAETMKALLSQRWLKVINRTALLSLWTDYQSGLHFVDSFLISIAATNRGNVLTFDKAIQRVKSNK